MVRLTPIKEDKIWGSEFWLASRVEPFSNLKKVTGEESFPILIKMIDAKDFLSVQVHPSDENCARLESGAKNGKSECWYVLDAAADSVIIAGLKKGTTKADLSKALEEGSVEKLLNKVKVQKGDFVYIGAGMIHALGAGVKVLEVQQPSNTTYRLFDWGRARPLDIEKALECTDVKSRAKVLPYIAMKSTLQKDCTAQSESETKREDHKQFTSDLCNTCSAQNTQNENNTKRTQDAQDTHIAQSTDAQSSKHKIVAQDAQSAKRSTNENDTKSLEAFCEGDLIYGDGEFSCPYFFMEELNINGGYSILAKQVLFFFVIEGEGEVASQKEVFTLKPFEIICVLSGEKVTIRGKIKVMKIGAKE